MEKVKNKSKSIEEKLLNNGEYVMCTQMVNYLFSVLKEIMPKEEVPILLRYDSLIKRKYEIINTTFYNQETGL